MTNTTRDEMIAGAVILVRSNGIAGTSIRDVVEFTGTPRGSVSHHFPGGKYELMEGAVRLAGEEVSVSLRAALERGAEEGLSTFIQHWCDFLEENEFSLGCAVLAAAVEDNQIVGDQSSELNSSNVSLAAVADEIFVNWQNILAEALGHNGLSQERSTNAATLVVSALEGAIVLCRAAKSTAPLQKVGSEFRLLLSALKSTD